MHGLERLVQDNNAAGEHFAAAAHAGRLVELDPLSEVYGRHLIRSLLLSGDRSSAERHHVALTQRLRDELGVAPEAATEALMDPASWPASFCSAHWPRAVGRRTIRTRCRQTNTTPGASSSSPNGAALPGSRPSRRALLVIPRRGPGGPGCCARPPVPAAFGPCSRRCATPT